MRVSRYDHCWCVVPGPCWRWPATSWWRRSGEAKHSPVLNGSAAARQLQADSDMQAMFDNVVQYSVTTTCHLLFAKHSPSSTLVGISLKLLIFPFSGWDILLICVLIDSWCGRRYHLQVMSINITCMSGLVLYLPICSEPAPDPAGSPHQPNCQWRRANRLMNDNKQQSSSSNIASLIQTNIISQNMATIKMMNQRDGLVNLKFRIL